MKLKIEKRGLVTSLLILIGLIVYNVLYFVIPFNRDLSVQSYWVTYGVTTFVMLFMAVVVFLGIGSKNIKSRLFGVPILYLGLSVFATQIIIDVLVMIIGNFVTFKLWITIVLETLLLAFFLVSLIARTAYKDTIDKIDGSVAKESFIKELKINIEILVNSCSKNEISVELNKLFDTVKYADPVSDPIVAEIEDEINERLNLLKIAINDSKYNEAKNEINKINSLMTERKLRLRSQR